MHARTVTGVIGILGLVGGTAEASICRSGDPVCENVQRVEVCEWVWKLKHFAPDAIKQLAEVCGHAGLAEEVALVCAAACQREQAPCPDEVRCANLAEIEHACRWGVMSAGGPTTEQAVAVLRADCQEQGKRFTAKLKANGDFQIRCRGKGKKQVSTAPCTTGHLPGCQPEAAGVVEVDLLDVP
jgi:hypothetical protein